MISAEERLADALAAVASRIPDESLRPLRAVDGFRAAAGRRCLRQTRWLAPIAAAAAVLVVLALAVLVPRGRTAGQFANAGTASAPPPFYVSVDANDQILVHSTSTGEITAMTDQPSWLGGGGLSDTAVAASPSGPAFAAAMNDWDSHRTRIYTFSVTSSGQIEDLVASTIRVPGLTMLSAALSPDGSELALAGVADGRPPCCNSADGPPKLLVVNLRTGHLRTWTGPARSGSDDLIQNPAWSGNRALYFLVTHCRGRADGLNATCSHAPPTGQEWAAAVHSGAAGLTVHRTAARFPAWTSQAVPVPGPALIVLTAAKTLTIDQYTADGTLIRTLYRGRRDSDLQTAHLSVDDTGRYVILNEDSSTVFGWISNGKLHKLSTRGPHGSDELLSTAW